MVSAVLWLAGPKALARSALRPRAASKRLLAPSSSSSSSASCGDAAAAVAESASKLKVRAPAPLAATSGVRISRRSGRRGSVREVAALAVQEEAEEVAMVKRGVGAMVWQPILGDAIFRFDVSEAARKEASPSLSFERQASRDAFLVDGEGRASMEDPLYVPVWKEEHGQKTVAVEVPGGSSFYGTGEVSGGLERSGRRVVTWNTDAWGYGAGTSSLYQSHPWVFVVFPGGEAFGVLADTSLRLEIDLKKPRVVRFKGAPDAPPFPVITFGPYARPEMLCAALARAVGTAAMPPKWTLGFHQCRWSYDSAERVREVAATFRAKSIPCDVLWMDIDYMDGFRCFTFDPVTFPDPKGLSDHLHGEGFRGVWMLDPGIKQEAGYGIHDSGSAVDAWIQTKNGKPYAGNVWPGPCLFPDFTIGRARAWWAENVRKFCEMGVDGIWNDMNEPAVFNSVSKTMPLTNIHRGDAELGGKKSHAFYHNAYGTLMARSTYEGMLLANPGRRPFVLTRACLIGSQRYAATWTGDNVSTWEHLHMSVPMALNLGLSGQPLVGPDIGGFAGDATPRMFARWMGVGSLLPFCRAHSEKGTSDHEPWSFGKEVEDVCRLALERRYRLLPHLYTLMYLAHRTGIPVTTPLFFADPKDPRLREADDAFLLGSLLVSVNTSLKTTFDPASVLLPNGIWRWFDFQDQHTDLPLLHLRGGSIVPTGAVIQNVGQARDTDAVVLLVALDESGSAEGTLFEDDGDGFGYKKGDYRLTRYQARYSQAGNGVPAAAVVVSVRECEGRRKRPQRLLKVRLLVGDGVFVEAEGRDGEEVLVKLPPAEEIAQMVAGSRRRLQALVEEQAVHDAGADHLLKEEAQEEEQRKTLVDLVRGDWALKVVPGIGGRITSMVHLPSKHEWLWSRVESGGYEEYSGVEYRSAGCTEFYHIVDREQDDALCMEGDIGGGLVLARRIGLSGDATPAPGVSESAIQICSRIEARSVGAGSGGFSRLVCLRVHPTFRLIDPTASVVRFTAIDGSMHEITSEAEDASLQGDSRPNGVWSLIDTGTGLAVVNTFEVEEVATCYIHWGSGSCNLELWSEERPVSADTPIQISHEYRLINTYGEISDHPPEIPVDTLLRFEQVNDITVHA